MQGKAKDNLAFRLRLEASNKLLDKHPVVQKGDEDGGDEDIIVSDEQKDNRRTISTEMVQKIEDIALISEGSVLYRRHDYNRAIEAFTKVIDKSKDNLDVLIYRANCYIQVGRPEDALTDIDQVLHDQPKNPQAILAKAEAYFSMGEFEFALVFFEKGYAERKDMTELKDGITKSKHAILDSIKGKQLFQPNPSFAASHKRTPLLNVTQTVQERSIDEQKVQQTQKFLPEKVLPLGSSIKNEDKKNYLGELGLDYDYLIELREELLRHKDDQFNYGKKEDEIVLKIVEEALAYLDQRAAFWCQQASKDHSQSNTDDESPSTRTRNARPKTVAAKSRGVKTAQVRTLKTPHQDNRRVPHYEMSKIQQYQQKYGTNEKSARRN